MAPAIAARGVNISETALKERKEHNGDDGLVAVRGKHGIRSLTGVLFRYRSFISVTGMPKSSVICAAVGVIALHLSTVHVFAQAGSTGGSIGKTDKSASGGGEGEPSRHVAKPRAVKKPAPNSREETRAVVGIDGTWHLSATGKCIPPWNLTWLVSNGAITGSGTNGQISRGGAASGVVDVLGLKFNFIGHFAANSANGTFTGGDGCPGTWSATKSPSGTPPPG